MSGHLAAAAERALHKFFRHVRIRGEWFKPTRQLMGYIDQVREYRGYTTP